MPPKKRTLRRIVRELVDNPFLPLLFISEAIKIAALGGPTIQVARMAGLGAVATVAWVISDAIDVDVDSEAIVGDD